MSAGCRLSRPKLLLWAVLALPALAWLWQASRLAAPELEELLHPTGELSARLLILALMLTPLVQLIPSAGLLRWLLRHRRALGVAAFGYALLHTGFYLVAMGTVEDVLAEALAIGIWPGWAALLFMLPPALASNDAAIRALKAGWKRVQRLAYPAALMTLAHWVFIHNNRWVALLHFAPLLVLEAWRMVRRASPRKEAIP
jgi:sulfoxide reductase heme-binding subunit YedZ